MLVLGIDTSTMTGGAALVSERGLIGDYNLNIRSTHSERLLPAIEQVLTDAELTLDNIEGVSVVTGPGSFTGLRIGVATAKGFGFAKQIPLVGVTTLQALAWQYQHFPGVVCPLVDARRSEVYGQQFQAGNSQGEPINTPLAQFLTSLQTLTEPILFVGDGAFTYQEMIKEYIPNACFPATEGFALRASAVAGLGREQLLQGKQDHPLQLTPFYMRKSEAEIKWERKQG